ncbi:Protein of unknown function [Gryllus bimaculatus]|nr:Protein of unknown function [Gryllus bimaculatus]
MERRSQKALASMPTAAVVGLVLALGSLTTRTTAAPYILVANVVSHFVVHQGGSTLPKPPQIDVQCSSVPGVQCRTLIQDNRLIINVYQDDKREESSQSLEETQEDNTVVSTFRWFSSKPDRISTNSNIDNEHLQEAELTSSQNVNVFESDDTQDENVHQTSQDHGADSTDDYREESAERSKESDEDNTVVPKSRWFFENSAEEATKQVSEFEHDEEQSEDHDYKVSQIPHDDDNELSNDNNSDHSKNVLEFSRPGKSEESKSLFDNHFPTNNEDEHPFEDYEDDSEEAAY